MLSDDSTLLDLIQIQNRQDKFCVMDQSDCEFESLTNPSAVKAGFVMRAGCGGVVW